MPHPREQWLAEQYVTVHAEVMGGDFSCPVTVRAYRVNFQGKEAPMEMRVKTGNFSYEIKKGQTLPVIGMRDYRS